MLWQVCLCIRLCIYEGCTALSADDVASHILAHVAATAQPQQQFKAHLRERATKPHWVRRPLAESSPRTDPHMFAQLSHGTAPNPATPPAPVAAGSSAVLQRLRLVGSRALRQAVVHKYRHPVPYDGTSDGTMPLTPLHHAIVDVVLRCARAGVYQAPLELLLGRPRDTLKCDLDFLVKHGVIVRLHRALFEDEPARAFQRRHAATVFVSDVVALLHYCVCPVVCVVRVCVCVCVCICVYVCLCARVCALSCVGVVSVDATTMELTLPVPMPVGGVRA